MKIKYINAYWQDILLLLFVCLAATLINPNWAFSPLEILPDWDIYSDHWHYIAPMLDLTDKFTFIIDTYNSRYYGFERFSWILPGALLYQTFSPVIANYLLKFAVYGLSIGGIYWALHNLCGRKTALFTALILGSYSWFLRSVGWDYVDGIGIAYFLMTFALMVASLYAKRHTTWRVTSFLAGAMVVNLAVTNLYWGAFIPHLLLIALWLNHRQHKRPIIQSLLWAIAGVVITLVLYGIVSYVISGEWIFLKNSISASNTLSGNQALSEAITTLYDGMTPYYHVIPLVLSLASINWLLKRSPKQDVHFLIQRLLLIQFVWFYVILIVSHYVILPYLIIFLYSSYVIPAMFLWFGGIVSPQIEKLSPKQFQRLIIAMVILGLSPFAIPILLPTLDSWKNNNWLLLLSSIVILLSLLRVQRLAGILLFSAFIVFSWASSKEIYVFNSDRLHNQEMFLMAFDAYEEVQNHYIRNGYRDIQFIMDRRASTGLPMVVVPLLYFDAYYWRGLIYGHETETDLDLIVPPFNRISSNQDSQKTVLMTRYPQTLNNFLAHYITTNRHLYYELEKSVTIQRYGMTFYMHFLSIYHQSLDHFVQEFSPDDADKLSRIEVVNFGDVEFINNRSYRWTIEPIASMTFENSDGQFDPTKTYRVQFWTLTPLEAEVQDSLRVSINGHQLTLERIPQGTDTLFQADITGAILNQPVLELVFETDRISRPADFGYPDPRTLGVALDWLTIEPIEE